MNKPHDLQVIKSPINFRVFCSCGFSRTITRRQNAWARTAQVNAARNEHYKIVAAEETRKPMQAIDDGPFT